MFYFFCEAHMSRNLKKLPQFHKLNTSLWEFSINILNYTNLRKFANFVCKCMANGRKKWYDRLLEKAIANFLQINILWHRCIVKSCRSLKKLPQIWYSQYLCHASNFHPQAQYIYIQIINRLFWQLLRRYRRQLYIR